TCELFHQRHELDQRIAVDAQSRGRGPGDGEGSGDVTATEALRQLRAKPGFQRIEPRSQPKSQIERFAVDALDFPNPGDPELVTLPPREPRHAGYAHARRGPSFRILTRVLRRSLREGRRRSETRWSRRS